MTKLREEELQKKLQILDERVDHYEDSEDSEEEQQHQKSEVSEKVDGLQ